MVTHSSALRYGICGALIQNSISTLNDPSPSLCREGGIGTSERGAAVRRHRVLISHLTSQLFVVYGTHDGAGGFMFNVRGKMT